MYCFAKVCRLCLIHDSVLIHCRARDKNNIPNYYKIKVLFPLMVNKTSQNFPIWICLKCQEQVNQLYEFKQKCYKTYKLLRKYSLQLYEANQGKNVPNVPTEIFQEFKPTVDQNVVILDEDDHSENYYNADDITIVKNELLPNNLKNEPEYNNMIQSIIDNNIETIRQIDSFSVELKGELVNNLETSTRCVQQAPETEETVNCNETPVEVSNTTAAANEQVENSGQINSLDAIAFTLDYTNASFETFASQVAPNINVPTAATVGKNSGPTAQNIFHGEKRVLRQRKSICYRTLEKCFELDDLLPPVKEKRRSLPPKKILRRSNSVSKTPTKKQQTRAAKSFPDLLVSPSSALKQQTVKKNLKKSSTTISVNSAPETPDNSTTKTPNNKCPYFCNKCSKEYKRFRQFRMHVSACKNSSTRYNCTVCHRSYSSNSNLMRHAKVQHASSVKLKMRCHVCSNQYVHISNLRKHMQLKHNLDADQSNPVLP